MESHLMKKLLEKIAQKHLVIDDLVETGCHDDVVDCPKACIREALKEAFVAGMMAGTVWKEAA